LVALGDEFSLLVPLEPLLDELPPPSLEPLLEPLPLPLLLDDAV